MANSKSNGTKMTRSKASSTTGRKKTSKNSSTNVSVKTQENLKKNLEKLASPKQPKKTPKTSGTTNSPKKTTSRKKVIEPKNSRKQELFPHQTFPYRLEIKKQKRLCWFVCHEHALKEITRYNLQPKDYIYQVYPKYL